MSEEAGPDAAIVETQQSEEPEAAVEPEPEKESPPGASETEPPQEEGVAAATDGEEPEDEEEEEEEEEDGVERVLVTGASGFIASQLIQSLLKDGKYRVRGTVRSKKNKEKVCTQLCGQIVIYDMFKTCITTSFTSVAYVSVAVFLSYWVGHCHFSITSFIYVPPP